MVSDLAPDVWEAEWADALDAAAAAVRSADALLIGAGAGMGVDSGLPDFRGPEGFWRAYPPFRQLGLSFSELARPRWFEADPHLAWGFYGHRLHSYRATRPHAGFEILRQWAAARAGGHFVFTSNVDGQFQRAGFAPDRVVECHGSIHHLQCVKPCAPEVWPADGVEVSVDPVTFRAADPLPRCRHCPRLARPNILMFGDSGWLDRRTEAQHRLFMAWLRALGDLRLVVIECGAGGAIPTVRDTCETYAGLPGATLIRLNPREPQVPAGRHVGLPAGALAGLRAIHRRL